MVNSDSFIICLFYNGNKIVNWRLSDLNYDQISKFLFVFEGIGAIFAGAFLVAYLSGLPTDVVYHSDPTLRLVLSIFGGIFILLIFVALIASRWITKKE
jgi:hypothetical protein